MSDSTAKLQRLLGGPSLLPLRQRLRRHFEQACDSGNVRQTLLLTRLNATEHEALALLTGRPARSARSAHLDIARIDAALRAAGICASLREALELLDGPITDHVATRTAARAAWSAIGQGSDRDHRLQGWLQTRAGRALLKRLSRQDANAAETLLTQTDAVLRCLPAMGIPRAQLAAQTLGNAHALDAGQAVASLVLSALRCAEASMATSRQDASLAPAEFEPVEAPSQTSERIRDIWARAGILVNELARPALALNLPVERDTAPSVPGEPSYLSLRQLVRTPPPWRVRNVPIFVCENPNFLAIAADRLGAGCAPLVCTEGMPAAAQRTLLDQLQHGGACLHYHGDFDWPGLRIANHVMRTWPALPWRMAAHDYETAVRTAPHTQRDLDNEYLDALWDPLLAVAMHHHGLSIAEEAVADALIGDLQAT